MKVTELNNYAIGVADLGDAFRSSASNLALANTDIEQSIGLITASFEILQDSGRVGNGLKTISMRVQNFSSDLEALGISVYDTGGKLRSLYDIMLDASKVYDAFKQAGNDAKAYSVLEVLGGKQQGAVVASIIQNIETMQKAYETASNSAGSATREQERLMNSLDAKMNALRENMVGLWTDISNSSALKGIVDDVNNLVSAIRNSESIMNGFSSVFSGVSSTVNGVVNVISFFTDKIGLVGTVVTGVIAKLSLTNTKFKNFADSLTNCIPYMSKFKDGMTSLGVKCLSYAENIKTTIAQKKQFIATSNLSTVASAKESASLVALNAKMALAKAGAVALQGAMIALNAVMSIGLSVAISAGMTAINNLIHAEERLKEANDEYLSSLSNGDTFDASGAEKALATYKRLSKELSNLTPSTQAYKDKEEELIAVKNQLIQILPEAEQLFIDVANAKGLDTEATQELINKNKELALTEANKTLAKNDVRTTDDIKELIKEYDDWQKQQDNLNKAMAEGETHVDSWTKAGVKASIQAGEHVNSTQKIEKAYNEVSEGVDQAETKIRAIYEALKNSNISEAKDMAKMLTDHYKWLSDEVEGVGNSADNTTPKLDDLGRQFEDNTDAVDNFADSIKGLQDAFSGLQDGIDLLQDMIEEFQEFGALTDSTMEKALSSGDANIIALLRDNNTFLQNAIDLQSRYSQEKENMKNAIIDQAYAEVQANGQVIDSVQGIGQAYSEQIDIIQQATNRLATDAQMPEINIGSDVVDKVVEEYGNAINEMIGMSDDLSRELTQALMDYVNEGGQLYNQDLNNKELTEQAKAQCGQMWKNQEIQDLASMILANSNNYNADVLNWANAVNTKTTDGVVFEDNVISQIAEMITLNAQNYSADTVNWASAVNNKDKNNVNMVNSIIQAIAKMILANSQNYSADTVAWAEAINNKDKNNAQLCTGVTQQMAQALNNMNTQYMQDVQNFQNACNSKVAMYNAIASKMQSINNNLQGNAMAGDSADDPVALNKLKIAQKLTNDIAKNMEKIDEVNSNYSGATVAGIQVAGGAGASGVGSGNYVSGGANKGSGSSGSKGSSGSGSTEKEVADLEDLKDRYAELEKAISKTNNEIELYASLQESANGQEAVKYIELQINAYKKLQKQEEELLKAQQKREAELRAELRSNGFDVQSDGMITNYESQMDALRNNANALSGEQKQKEIDRVKELNSLIEEYNELVSDSMGNTKKEIADINNQIRDLYRSKLDLVGEVEGQIYDVIEYFANKQVDAQKEALEKVQDARKKMRDEEDYEKQKAERIKDLADLEAQMEILSRDQSRQGQAKLKELQQQYADMMNELDDTVKEHQDQIFDNMIDEETKSLEQQLEEFLDPSNINKIIADAMNSGMVDVMGTTYNLNELTQAYLADTEIGLTNATVKMNEYIDAINQAQSAYVNLSDAWSATNMDGTMYTTGQDYSNQISGNNNNVANVNYVLTFPDNIASLDRQEIEAIITPMLEYTKQQTIEEVTKALNGETP